MATTSIPEFYAGRSIFITGATGFMGKVLLEKILRSCPSICAAYILVRPRKGQAAPDRLKDILKAKLFNRLRLEQPDFAEKIKTVAGDILEPQFAISADDLEKLKENVSIVFHVAATVKFDEALKLSLQMNVLGVQKVVELSHKLPLIESLVHVSTAYCNCDRYQINEEVYPAAMEPSKLLRAAEWMTTETMDSLTPRLIPPRPNTYTYTKALAESLLQEQRGSIPVCIIRPSIVGASWLEPLPGWVDNFNGPTGLLAAIGTGLLRTMHGKRECIADLTPVDMATNLMIAAAWSTSIERPKDVTVYNCTTGQINKVTWGSLEKSSYKYLMAHPLDNVARVPKPRFTTSKITRTIRMFLDHYLPAAMLDLYRTITGHRAIFVRLQKRLWRSVLSLEYFTSNGWDFQDDNVRQLLSQLSREDRQNFGFDFKQIDWDRYIENYCLGVKKYALKESLEDLPQARKRMIRIKRLTRLVKVLSAILIWRFFLMRFQVFRNLWYFFISAAVGFVQKLPSIFKS